MPFVHWATVNWWKLSLLAWANVGGKQETPVTVDIHHEAGAQSQLLGTVHTYLSHLASYGGQRLCWIRASWCYMLTCLLSNPAKSFMRVTSVKNVKNIHSLYWKMLFYAHFVLSQCETSTLSGRRKINISPFRCILPKSGGKTLLNEELVAVLCYRQKSFFTTVHLSLNKKTTLTPDLYYGDFYPTTPSFYYTQYLFFIHHELFPTLPRSPLAFLGGFKIIPYHPKKPNNVATVVIRLIISKISQHSVECIIILITQGENEVFSLGSSLVPKTYLTTTSLSSGGRLNSPP